MTTQKQLNEIQHGKDLIAMQAEDAWGWGSPAGKLRAQRRASLVAEAARLRTGKLALELGCGTGLFTQAFAESGATILALDISQDLLDIATQREFPQGNVQFVCSAFEASRVEQHGPFDALIGSSVLHHLELPAAFERSYELLKPGGLFSFAEPNMLNPQVFAERTFLRNSLAYVSPDETAFVRWMLAAQLKAVGFEEVRIVPFDWLHPATPESLIRSISALGKLAEKLPLVREFAGSLIISARKPS